MAILGKSVDSLMAQKRSKFRAIRVITPDGAFDSKGEYARYCVLKIEQRTGRISDLKHHVPFELKSYRGVALGKIIIDYTYIEDGQPVAEDFKGMLLDLAKWKLRHLAADYKFKVRIYRKGKPIEEMAA